MNYEAFTAEVNAAIAAITAASNGTLTEMPDVDYCIEACECAAEITGADVTLCKMFNRQFRNAAAKTMFDRRAA